MQSANANATSAAFPSWGQSNFILSRWLRFFNSFSAYKAQREARTRLHTSGRADTVEPFSLITISVSNDLAPILQLCRVFGPILVHDHLLYFSDSECGPGRPPVVHLEFLSRKISSGPQRVP